MQNQLNPFKIPNLNRLTEKQKEFQQIVDEYFRPRRFFELLGTVRRFLKTPMIMDTNMPNSTGLTGLSGLLYNRLQFLLSQTNFCVTQTETTDERDIEATQILRREKQYLAKKNLDLESYFRENPDAIFVPVMSDSNELSQASELILNNCEQKFPVWMQELSNTFSKVNYAKICQQIHSGNLGFFNELCDSLGFTDLESQMMLKNLKEITPDSDFITNFENSCESVKDLMTKSITIATKSPTSSVFIKNDLAAGFGVVKFDLLELYAIKNAENPLQIYKKILANKITIKSPEFAQDKQKLQDHIENVFCNWPGIAIQEALEIEEELSFQFVNGQIVATTINLVDSEKNQHIGNQVKPFDQINPILEKAVKFLNLAIMCQFEEKDCSPESVKNAIKKMSLIPYFGIDLIKNIQGQVKFLECNIRPTGVTPSFLRLILHALQTGYLPREYLTKNVVFANLEEKDLLNLATNLQQQLELYGLNVDIYSILNLPIETPHPIGQVIVSKLPGESEINFQIRKEADLLIIQDFDAKNSITYLSRLHATSLRRFEAKCRKIANIGFG